MDEIASEAAPSEEAEAPSPFIKGTKIQMAIDSTSIGLAKTCLRKYHYTIIDGWRKKDESVHLTFGGEFARWLEFYSKRRAESGDHEDALDLTVDGLLTATFGWNSDHPKKNRYTLVRSVIWYLDTYQNDPAKTYIRPNGVPAVELSFKLELPWEAAPGQPYILCGHLDKVVNYGDDLFILDNKTTAGGIGAYYFAEFNPHNQMSLYSWAGKAIFDLPIAGVIIDAAQIATGYTSFARGFTMRTRAQMDEWIRDLQQFTEILKFAAERDYWPMNDTACSMYGGCTFREVCSQDPSVRQHYLETKFEKRIWNPLISR